MKRLNTQERGLYFSRSDEIKQVVPEEFLKQIQDKGIEQCLLVFYEMPTGQVEDILYLDPTTGQKCRVHIYIIDDEPWSWSDRHWQVGDKTVQGVDIQTLKTIYTLTAGKEQLQIPLQDYKPNIYVERPAYVYRVRWD